MGESGTAYQHLESIQCYRHVVLWLSVATNNHGYVVVPMLRNSNGELLLTLVRRQKHSENSTQRNAVWETLNSESPYLMCKECSIDRIQNIYFSTTTVFRTLKRLDTSKATGPDDISAHVLEPYSSRLALPLPRPFSLCFRSGIQSSS